MRERTKALSILMSVVATSQAYANLPDEIDFKTYLKQYNASKNSADTIRTQATEAMQAVIHTEQSIEDLKSQVSNKQIEIDQSYQNIDRLIQLNSSLESEKNQLEEENRSLRFNTERLSDEISQIENGINRANNELRRPLERKRGLDQRMVVVQQDLDNLIVRKRDLEREKDQGEKRLAKNKNKFQALRDEVQKLTTQVPRIENKIQTIKSEQVELRNKLSQLKAKKISQKNKVDSLKSELSPLEQELAGAKGKLREFNKKLGPLKTKLANVKSKEGVLKEELLNLKYAVNSANAEIENFKKQKSSLPQEISSLKSDLATNSSETSAAKATLASKESEAQEIRTTMQSKRLRLKELKQAPQTPETKAEAQKLRREIQKLRGLQKNITSQIAQAKGQIDSLVKEEGRITKTIQSKKALLKNIDSKIAAKKQEKKAAKAKIPGVSSKLATVEGERSVIEAELSQFDGKVAKLKQRVANKKSAVEKKQGEISTVQSKLTDTETKISNKSQEVKNNTVEVKRLKDKLAKGEVRLAEAKKESKQVRRKISRINDNLGEISNTLNLTRSSIESLRVERASVERRLAEVNSTVAAIQSHLSSLHRDREIRISQLADTQVIISQNVDQIISNTEEIAQNNEDVTLNNEAIASAQDLIIQLKDEKLKLITELPSLKEDHKLKDTDALRLEALAEGDFQEFAKRDSLYKSYLAEANELGDSQGELAGKVSGVIVSSRDVQASANKYGTKNGKTLGDLSGYLKGLLTGKENGNRDGYDSGVQSQDDYSAGHNEGYELGHLNAKDFAKRTEFPRGYRELKAELLADLPASKVVVNNNSQLTKSSFEKMINASPFDTNEIVPTSDEDLNYVVLKAETSGDNVPSSVDAEISSVAKSIATNKEPTTANSRPDLVYVTPSQISIETQDRDCNAVYKNVTDFIAACEESYKSGYEVSFKASHKDKFFEKYEELFEKYRDSGIADTEEGRFEIGKDKAYKIVFAEAKQRGAAVAYQAGFDEGKVKGYDENILDERAVYFQKGKIAVGSFFDNNGVVRLNSGQNTFIEAINPKGLIQGSEFKMGAELVNFGKKESVLGDVIAEVVNSSSNISFKSKREIVTNIPAKSQAKVLELFKSRITQNAMPGSNFNVTVKFTYPGDDLDGRVTELATFMGKVKVNPEIKSALGFDSEVKWRKWKPWPIKWKYRAHNINVNLTGLRDNIPGNYRVTLEATSGQKYINVETKSLEVAAPAQGAVKTVGLRYKFKNKAKDKKVSFRVKVFYGKELLKTENITIKSK